MKRISLVAIIVVVSAIGLAQGGGNAPRSQSQPLPEVPKTVDEAVLILKTKWLSRDDLDWVLRNPQDEVVYTLYRPFGTGVRNQFGLWGRNQELRASCGTNDPEACSVVIFRRLWESVRADGDPSLVRQLDCQFQLVRDIHISYKGFYKLTTGELIKSMQAQVNDQMAKLASTGASTCQGSLILETAGNPDLHCYVDASFAMDKRDNKKEASLEKLLPWLEVRNFFRASHEPPKLVLNFTRKCQFSTPPYLYGSGVK